jgi:hypothetical protein
MRGLKDFNYSPLIQSIKQERRVNAFVDDRMPIGKKVNDGVMLRKGLELFEDGFQLLLLLSHSI